MFGSPSADVNNRQRLAVIDFMLCAPCFTLSDLVSGTRLDATIVHSIVNEVQDHLTQVGTRDVAPQRRSAIEYHAESSLLGVRESLDRPSLFSPFPGVVHEGHSYAVPVNYRERLRASVRRLDAISEHLQRAISLLEASFWYDAFGLWCNTDTDEVIKALRHALANASPSVCSRGSEESLPVISALLEEAVDLAIRHQPVLPRYGWSLAYPPEGLLSLVREARDAAKRQARELADAENWVCARVSLGSTEYANRPDLSPITFLLERAISQTELSASICGGWSLCNSAHVLASLRSALQSLKRVAELPRFSYWAWYPGVDWQSEIRGGLTSAFEAVEGIVNDRSRSTCPLCASSVEAAIVKRCTRIALLIEAALANYATQAAEQQSRDLSDAACLLLEETISETESSASICDGWSLCNSAHVLASLRNALRSLQRVAELPGFSYGAWYPGVDWHSEIRRGLASAFEAVKEIVNDHSRSTCPLCASCVEAAIVRRCDRISSLIEALLANHAAVPEQRSRKLSDVTGLFVSGVPTRNDTRAQRDSILDRPMLSFSQMDPLTLRNMFGEVIMFGSIGSGKTSAVCRLLSDALLRMPSGGGLVLTAKAEGTQDWIDYATACGRTRDLLIVADDSAYCFNPLDYEWARPGRVARDTESISDLLLSLIPAGQKKEGHPCDPFCESASEQLIRYSIDALCWPGTGRRILSSAAGLAPGSSARHVACGGGATFPESIYQEWIAQYCNGNPNLKLPYHPMGSEEGAKRFLRTYLDFAGCDWPLTLDGEGAALLILSSPLPRFCIYVPSVACTVAPIYRFAWGTSVLQFGREILAGIFRGDILGWADPVILCQTPAWPSRAQIKFVVRRYDGGGTTLVLTTFLADSAGVARRLTQTLGAIGYVEYPYSAGSRALRFGDTRNQGERPILARKEVLDLGEGHVCLVSIVRVIQSLRTFLDRCEDTWRAESYYARLISAMRQRRETLTEKQWCGHDFGSRYMFRTWQAFVEHSRASLEMTCAVIADRFLFNPFHRLFCGGCSFTPEMTTHDTKVVVCDFPGLEYGQETGQFMSNLLKLIFQQAWLGRKLEASPYPVSLCLDEFQHYMTRRDTFFQQAGRGSHGAGVCLNENTPNLFKEVGAEHPGSTPKRSLGYLDLKIFVSQSDFDTNSYAADRIGKQYCVLSQRYRNDSPAHVSQNAYVFWAAITLSSELSASPTHRSEDRLPSRTVSSSWRELRRCGDETCANRLSLWMHAEWSRAANTLEEGSASTWRDSSPTHRQHCWVFSSWATSNDSYLRSRRNTGGPAPGEHYGGIVASGRSDFRSGYARLEMTEIPAALFRASETCLQGTLQ